MVRLGSESFERAGASVFDENGGLNTLGPFRNFDDAAYFNWPGDLFDGAQTVEAPDICDIGPFNSASSYLLSKQHRYTTNDNKLNNGIDAICRLFIDWACQQSTKDNFVLTHPDFNLQNILVDSAGHV